MCSGLLESIRYKKLASKTRGLSSDGRPDVLCLRRQRYSQENTFLAIFEFSSQCGAAPYILQILGRSVVSDIELFIPSMLPPRSTVRFRNNFARRGEE